MTDQLAASRTRWGADERRRRAWTTRLLENRSFRLEQIDQLTIELATGGTPARQQVTAAMLAAAELSLRLTQDALDRVATETFGTCGTCSRPIELERLDIVPMLASCTACQYQADHERPAGLGAGRPGVGDDGREGPGAGPRGRAGAERAGRARYGVAPAPTRDLPATVDPVAGDRRTRSHQMQILLNTDKHVGAEPQLVQQVRDTVGDGLRRFAGQLTRVEVHLSDQSASPDGAAALRCTIEARPAGRPPIAVHENAASAEQASAGAVAKMRNLLETAAGRAEARQGRDTIRRPRVPADDLDRSCRRPSTGSR